MAPKKGLSPGTRAAQSGQYKKLGPRGGDTGVEITSTKGKPLPPSDRPGETYVLVDPTKHKKK